MRESGRWSAGIVHCVVAALLLVAAPRAADAGPTSSAADEDGASAPEGCWTTAAGCPARTASARTPPVSGPVAVAWEQTLRGEIEGEPLVWGGTVLAVSVDKDGLRTMTEISLATGKVLGRKTWRTSAPLLPSVSNGIVAVRAAPMRVELMRLRPDGFVPAGAIDVGDQVRDLLLFQREIYVRANDTVMRYDIGSRVPVWIKGERCRGRLALRGRYVYCTEYDKNGNAYLWQRTRAEGTGGRVLMGHHDGRVPDADAAAPLVQAFAERVLVHHELGIVTKDGGTLNVADARRVQGKDGSSFLAEAVLVSAPCEAAETTTGYFGSFVGKEGTPELWDVDRDNKHWTLATFATQPAYAQPPVPPSVSGGYAYLGASAVELSTRRIAWSAPQSPVCRAVPARDAVLVASRGGKLVALRPPRPPDAAAQVLTASDASVAGRVVLRDGSVLAGTLRVRKDAPLVVDGSPPRSVPLTDVALAEDQAGTALAIAPDAAAWAVDQLAARETALAYAALAVQAIAARDPALLQRLVTEASVRGAEQKDLARAESQLKEFLVHPPAQANAAEVAKVLAAERDVAATGARAYWERARRLSPDAPRAVLLDLLDGALARDPSNAGATALVRSLLPAGVTPPEPFDARDWITLLHAIEFTPVEIVRPPTPGATDISPGQRLYGMYLSVWRKDLVALQSKQLLVISAPVKPGRIANCLSAGELVCDALESVFSAGKHVRDRRWPMTIFLFEDRDEYLRVLGKGARGEEEQRMLQWSIGQYSSGTGSALYLPEDEDGFRRVLRTFVHELTHQWLAERCPLYSAAESGRSDSQPGHFVVEGFAEMMEEMTFDLERRTWSFDPGAASLDEVASMPQERLFGWTKFLGLTARDFVGLDHENVIPVRGRRSLAGERKISEGHVFYSQGAAVCHYLFQAEGGRRRQALLDFAAAYYAGSVPKVETAFGMTPDELGTRVLAFALAPGGR